MADELSVSTDVAVYDSQGGKNMLMRRKMKGLSAEESLSTYIEVMFFAGTVTAILFFISMYIISFDSVLAETSSTLDAVDASYMMDACLRGDRHYIDAATLTEKRDLGVNIARSCGISRDDLGIEIKDLQGSSSWDFNYGRIASSHTHSIFVNIKVGNDIHIGELKTKIGWLDEYEDVDLW